MRGASPKARTTAAPEITSDRKASSGDLVTLSSRFCSRACLGFGLGFGFGFGFGFGLQVTG